MTRIQLFTCQEAITGFRASDHADYADEGQDIVCAAVSVLTITAVNALQAFGIDCTVRADEEKAQIAVKLGKTLTDAQKHDAQIILKSMEIGLTDIANQYPEFVKVIHEERR